jgi:ethanolamine-phosphate phospho-lyase
VLDTIRDERLQANAEDVGNYLKEQLRDRVAAKYDWVGDVRGRGLFLGIEIVRSKYASAESRTPHPTLTRFLIDHMLEDEAKIVVSSDGPDENVIKFKPPLVFSKANADAFVSALERALCEAVKSGRY